MTLHLELSFDDDDPDDIVLHYASSGVGVLSDVLGTIVIRYKSPVNQHSCNKTPSKYDWCEPATIAEIRPLLYFIWHLDQHGLYIFRCVWSAFKFKLTVVRHLERFSTPDASSQTQWQDAERRCHLEKETKKPLCSVRVDTLACQRTSTEMEILSQTKYRMSAKDATDGTCSEKTEETTVLLEIFENHYTWGSPAIRFWMVKIQWAYFPHEQHVNIWNQLAVGIFRHSFIECLRVRCNGLGSQFTYFSHQGIGVRC